MGWFTVIAIRGLRWIERHARKLVFPVLMMSISAQGGDFSSIRLGMHAPVTPFMWEHGMPMYKLSLGEREEKRADFLLANLGRMRQWGAEWNIVTVRQWLDTEKEFDRLDRIVTEHDSRGLGVAFRIVEGPDVYSRLLAHEDPEFGYDKIYYDWIQSLAREFGDKVEFFLIGNESELDLGRSYHWLNNAPAHLNLSYDQYSKVLRTAVMAVDSVDATLPVANSGFSDKSVALAVTAEIREKDGLVEAQKFWEQWKGIGDIKAEGVFGLVRLLHDDDVQRRIEFVRRAVKEPMGSDLFQLHYYGGWRAVDKVLAWLEEEMVSAGVKRPIVATELGYRIRSIKSRDSEGRRRFRPDWNHYSQDEHAVNTVKNVVTLAGNGVKRILYWSMRETDDRGLALRLFPPGEDPNYFESNKVTRSFRTLGYVLNEMASSPGKMQKADGFREYRFVGDTDVSVAWGDGYSIKPYEDRVLEIRDIEGRRLDMATTVLSEVPVYIFWRNDGEDDARPQEGGSEPNRAN